MSDFNDVGEFHQKFGLDNVTHYLPGPRPVDDDLIEFRLKFLLEELMEFMAAVGFVMEWDPEKGFFFTKQNWPIDHALAFDALIDLNYVSLGTAHFLGYPWAEGWALVQEANMTKQRAQSAEESKAGTGRGHVLDVIKPPGWTPPNIGGLLKDYGFEFRMCTLEEYEPSEEHHPMHTDPLCKNCGGPKKDHK